MRIVIFTKPPVPGTCKTRLIPTLGAQGAAALHQAMAEDVISQARTVADVTVAAAGDVDHPWLRGLGVPVVPQVDGDLGARMLAAMQGPALALGTDAPTLPTALLREALRPEHPLVLGPAFDGGYWCLGWRRPRPELLVSMPWSTDAVYAETVLRARAHDIPTHTLPFWYDVDDGPALALLRQHLRVLPPSTAPRTRACLRLLDAPDHRPPA